MTVRGRWRRVFVDRQRCFVYGPRFGRLYLLATEQSTSISLQAMLGLRRLISDDALADPVQHVLCDRTSFRGAQPGAISAKLIFGYRLLHLSRHVLPLALAARLVRAIARLGRGARQADLVSIGRTLHGIEATAGFADCYPRALMSAYLCLRDGRECELAIGILSPTRQMHAWCSSEGQLVYEASPEHYMYEPLAIFSLSP